MRARLPNARKPATARTATAVLAVVALLLAFVVGVEARTIDWGGGFGDTNVQSDGTDIPMTFTFVLGTFGSFVPDDTNLALWAANWTVFDEATYNDTLDFFTSSVDADVDGGDPLKVISSFNPAGDFDIGEQAYIWVYNTIAYGDTAEWALFTDNDGLNGDDWLLPDPGDQTAQPLEWRVSNATTPVFGGVNSVTGPGERTATPPAFDIQTHKIPEPSSALLVVGGLGLLGARRKRSSKLNQTAK